MTTTATKQLYFIDQAVFDVETLIKQLPINTIYFIINTERDGLKQIADMVSSYTDLDAIHIISHGSTGTLQLGNSFVNSNNLDNYRDTLATAMP